MIANTLSACIRTEKVEESRDFYVKVSQPSVTRVREHVCLQENFRYPDGKTAITRYKDFSVLVACKGGAAQWTPAKQL
jgi:hypothetical protein